MSVEQQLWLPTGVKRNSSLFYWNISLLQMLQDYNFILLNFTKQLQIIFLYQSIQLTSAFAYVFLN